MHAWRVAMHEPIRKEGNKCVSTRFKNRYTCVLKHLYRINKGDRNE
jgi:hypothetical protein